MTTSYVIASVAGQCVAIDALAVEAIIRIGTMTPVPGAPAHVAGLCAVRSTVMTVIDVSRAAGQPEDGEGDQAAVVLHEGHRYALRLEKITDVEDIDVQPSANDPSIGAAWLAVAPLRIERVSSAALLLDLDRVINGLRD